MKKIIPLILCFFAVYPASQAVQTKSKINRFIG